jgi:hypothetical protein
MHVHQRNGLCGNMRASVSKKLGKTKGRRPSAAHLLVLECQQEKLAGEALDFGSRIVPVLKALYPKKRIALVPTSTYRDLAPSLAGIFVEHGPFRSVLIVGYSNNVGTRLTNGAFCTWSSAGLWITKFEPQILFFAACEAGRSDGVRGLFESIPTLREVYASPVQLCAEQSTPLAALIVLTLKGPAVNSDASSVVRTLIFAITGGQIFRWRRGELGDGQELTGKLWDSVASIFNHKI